MLKHATTRNFRQHGGRGTGIPNGFHTLPTANNGLNSNNNRNGSTVALSQSTCNGILGVGPKGNIWTPENHIRVHDDMAPLVRSNSCLIDPDIIKIYTDWANHYLEKCQKKKLIVDLQRDMQDSLLLVDVIESVTGEKVPEIKQKPKNPAQVVENFGSCLRFVESLGVNVEGLTAKDIRDGQLKAILGLFFSLSRYKQQQKSLASLASPKHQASGTLTCRSSAAPTSTGIPAPSAQMSAVAQGNCNDSSSSRLPSPFKSAQAGSNGAGNSPAHNGNSGIPAPQTPTKNTSKIVVQNSANGEPQSKLKGPAAGKLSGSKRDLAGGSQNELRKGSRSGIPAGPGAKNSSSGLKPPSRVQSPASTVKSANTAPPSVGCQQQQQGKMLEKFKIFGGGSKDKGGANSPRGSLPKSSTRASNSSSGFSSSRSEFSETMSPPNANSVGKINSMTNSGGRENLKDNSGIGSPRAALKSLTKKGLKSPKNSNSKAAWKSAKDTAGEKKVTDGAQTSPQLLRKRVTEAFNKSTTLAPPNDLNEKLSNENKSDTEDADSAYAGCDSSSPCSSNAPSDSKLYNPPTSLVSTSEKSVVSNREERRKSPIGAPAESKITSPTGTGVSKPTMAVKGVSAGSNPPGGKNFGSSLPTGLPKPSSLQKTANANGNGMKHSNSNSEKLNQMPKQAARDYA